MAKKSYNPFKMWGSWIGLIICYYLWGLLWTLGLCDSCETTSEIMINPLKSLIYIGTYYTPTFDEVIGFILLPMILGFLFGWGVHSLIRYLRR